MLCGGHGLPCADVPERPFEPRYGCFLEQSNGYGSFIRMLGILAWGVGACCLPAYAKSGLCSPVLTSAITIALFALGIVLLIDRLGIRRACLRYASSILFIALPFVSCCFTYYYCSNSYALSFLCAVLAVCGLGALGLLASRSLLLGRLRCWCFRSAAIRQVWVCSASRYCL